MAALLAPKPQLFLQTLLLWLIVACITFLFIVTKHLAALALSIKATTVSTAMFVVAASWLLIDASWTKKNWSIVTFFHHCSMHWCWCGHHHHSLLLQLPSPLTALVPLQKSLWFLQPSPPPDDWCFCWLLHKCCSLLWSLLTALVPSPRPKPLLFYNHHASLPDDCCLFDKNILMIVAVATPLTAPLPKLPLLQQLNCHWLIVASVASITRRYCSLLQLAPSPKPLLSLQPSLLPNDHQIIVTSLKFLSSLLLPGVCCNFCCSYSLCSNSVTACCAIQLPYQC